MTRIALICTTVFAFVLGAALPALAQAPAAAPVNASAPAPAPTMAPAPAPMPGPEAAAVTPVAPVVVPKAPDNMAGSLGLGVGLIAGTSLVIPDTADLLVKYWLRDAMAIMPRLQLTLDKLKSDNATWVIAPQVMALFVPWKTGSTRLNIGVGLGLAFAKFDPTQTDTTIDIFLPVHLGVEHFFTRWFSMGIAIETRLLDYAKEGPLWNLHFGLQTSGNNTYADYAVTSAGAATLPSGWSVTTALASLMFYTD